MSTLSVSESLVNVPHVNIVSISTFQEEGVNIIIGETGNDRVCGGSGNDIFAGRKGADKITGNGNDMLLQVMILLLPHYFPWKPRCNKLWSGK